MQKDKSVFERLDDISASQDVLLNEIEGVGNKVEDHFKDLDKKITNLQINLSSLQANKQTSKNEPPMKTFARQAKKSWRWFGNNHEFYKAKNAAILASFLMLILGLVSTIITGISTGMYSPFSGIENIWLVFSIIYLVYACKAPIKCEVNAFARSTPLKGERDDTGMVFPCYGEKRVFRIFRLITLLSISGNFVWIWTNRSNISWLATIVEVLFFASIVVANFVNLNLYLQYSICWLEGNGLMTGKKVTLIKMEHSKSFVLEKDFRETFPQLFE